MSFFAPATFVLRAASIAVALALDALFGDLPTSLHPVAWLGEMVASLERVLRRLPGLKGVVGGSVLALLTVLVSVGVSALLSVAAHVVSPLAGMLVDAILIWLALSARSLAEEGHEVADLLSAGDLSAARVWVARLVARLTDSLDETGVARAAIESLGENVVDGVIAPLFWAALLGAPGAWLHKAASTLDSMVGYRNERYERFGRVSARLDDVLAWVPARLALVVVPLAAAVTRLDFARAVRIGFADRRKHASPNSAHGEAAFAGALQVSLGGEVLYAEGPRDRPVIGEGLGEASAGDVHRAASLVIQSAVVTAVFLCAALLLVAVWRSS